MALEVDPKIQDFHKKTREAFSMLRKLAKVVGDVSLPDDMEPIKAEFCMKKKEELSCIKFDELIDHLTIGSEKVIQEFRTIHTSFYCLLCDYKAHEEINIEGKKIIYDGKTCMKQLAGNQNYIRAVNVSVVDYFEKVQHYLDCAGFDNEYEFPFLFEKEEKLAEETSKCLDKFDEEATELSAECKDMCQKFNVANFSPIFEGNHIFIKKASEYYISLAQKSISECKNKQKNIFNEIAKITEQNKEKVNKVHDVKEVKKDEDRRLDDEEKDRLFRISERERIKREKEAEEARKKAAAAAAAAAAASGGGGGGRKRNFWDKVGSWARGGGFRKLRNRKTFPKIKKHNRKLKSYHSIKKHFKKKFHHKNHFKHQIKKHKRAKLSRSLLLKHFPHLKNKVHKRKYRILEQKPEEGKKEEVPKEGEEKKAEDLKKTAEEVSPSGQPEGAPKDPVHEALLKQMKEVYDEIKFLFDANSEGIVKNTDLPQDVDAYNKDFLYGQGIDVYHYALNINLEISKTDLLALMNGIKPSDPVENRIIQSLAAISLENKAILTQILDTGYTFALEGKSNCPAEEQFAALKETLDADECFEEGCAKALAHHDNKPADETQPNNEGDKKPEENKSEEKKPEENKTKEERILEMKKYRNLESVFDLREHKRKKEILF